MDTKVITAVKVVWTPWISLTIESSVTVKLDNESGQARQGQGVVA
jgi:hypothetical protein